jgi:tyrosyl-tRNA synthetase
MSAYKSEFLQVLADRGFIHQVSDAAGLDARAAAGPITAYVGLDATAPSLHIGNLITIMMLRWLQKTGHRPIALMGGGTSKIGDPSGKDATRTLLSNEQIDRNIASIRTVFDRFLDFPPAIMANNAEFNYMILQAYDFMELYKRHGCILQMGGSDQWGNIINGVELGRRMLDAELFALTTPLLLTSAGTKMGKTETGSMWLNADMMSPYDYWQYWRNTDDADVAKLLKLFTELPLSEIDRLAALRGQEINEAKKVLATEATALLHGRAAAEAASETARTTFEEGALAETLPTTEIPSSEFKGIGVLKAFVATGLAPTISEARRGVRGGALRVNDERVTDEKMTLNEQHLIKGVAKLSFGRKQHALLKPVNEKSG